LGLAREKDRSTGAKTTAAGSKWQDEMKLMIELTIAEFDYMWFLAAPNFERENPRLPWTFSEKRRAVRAYLKSLIPSPS
jgi:hypothetical protein